MAKRERLDAMLTGAASIIDGMNSIVGALLPQRRSPQMRRILRDLRLSDAERLRRDWDMVIPRTPRPAAKKTEKESR